MGFFELFSRRNNPEREIDVYKYDEMDNKFRVQFIHILKEIIPLRYPRTVQIWGEIEAGFSKEIGKFMLGNKGDSHLNIVNFMMECNTEEYIDLLDYTIHCIYKSSNVINQPYSGVYLPEIIDDKIKEVNFRLRQNSIGYEVIDGQLVRIDNQYIHDEVVKNAIKLLHENNFESVSEEFLKAHEYYKQGDYKDAIVNAGKAFESTMKTICSKMGYKYDSQKDTANPLIKRLFDNGFIPSYMQNHFQGLRQALENSAHVLRNKNGGHGQGDAIVEVDNSIVRYTLNLCATNIVFLVDRYKEIK